MSKQISPSTTRRDLLRSAVAGLADAGLGVAAFASKSVAATGDRVVNSLISEK